MSALKPEELSAVIAEFQVLLPAQKIEFKRTTSYMNSSDLGSGDQKAVYEISAIGAGLS